MGYWYFILRHPHENDVCISVYGVQFYLGLGKKCLIDISCLTRDRFVSVYGVQFYLGLGKKCLIDISCLTRDRFVHHTLKYKRVLMGMSQNKIPISYTYMCIRF